ncbi:hypothetical protein Q8G40_29985, partial [Klebsiella pneumoniae]|uniref:hypothetical protein n=1 Tax=Klebsiella pneumoniae TaxID=573 RepID=UPI003013552A
AFQKKKKKGTELLFFKGQGKLLFVSLVGTDFMIYPIFSYSLHDYINGSTPPLIKLSLLQIDTNSTVTTS